VIIFYLVVISGVIRFFISKRTFDFFSIAYLSSIVYFLPAFFGYSLLPGGYKSPLLLETYLVMILVISSIIIFSFIYDYTKPEAKEKKINIKDISNIHLFLLCIVIVSFTLTILSLGSSLFTASKQDLMSHLNRWSLLWENTVCLGAVTSYICKKKKTFILYLAMICFIIFMGDRTIPAIAFIAIVTYSFFIKGKQKILFNNYKMILTSSLIIFFFFLYKYLYIDIKLGLWDRVLKNLSNPTFYLDVVKFSEPFSIQTILNETIRQDYKVGMEHFRGIINQFILFADKFGAQSTTFNSLFQNDLFPGVKYGMGSNIWAEMWSSGGYPLLVLFLILFNFILFVGNRVLSKVGKEIQSLVLIVMSYWSFYIQRNSLEYTINLSKRIFFIWIFVVLMSVIFNSLVKRKK
jgi:hypothetical protein